MAYQAKKLPSVTITTPRRSSTDSTTRSLKTPRTARFAEDTAVISPIEPTKSPFADPPETNHYTPQPQPSDIGFGYLSSGSRYVEMEESDKKMPLASAGPKSPLKSAMKSPGAPPRVANLEAVLSPTWKEEHHLEKQEEDTEKEQAKDLKVKIRVRMAKVVLRGVNFACSLIVLSMLATVFSIFNATRALPPRSGLPAWSNQSKPWPQIVLLVIACTSLAMCIVVFMAYCRGGHHRAEKVAVYYTVFSMAFFVFSIIMWGVGAGILNQSKAQGKGQDMWGWSCKDNRRKELFKDDVHYSLVCRLQDWSLVCCIIEIVVETLCIIIYGIVFYRFWSKRKLRKSMAVRDRARSDLYLAQLRSQSAPNTPGFGPMSPRSGGWRPPPGHPNYVDPADEEAGAQYPRGFAEAKPFTLQAPPLKVTTASPKSEQGSFGTPTTPGPLSPTFERRQEHMPAAPGEQQYGEVPIPGAYGGGAVASPGFAPPSFGNLSKEADRPAHQ